MLTQPNPTMKKILLTTLLVPQILPSIDTLEVLPNLLPSELSIPEG